MFNHLSEAKWPDHIAWADGPGWLAAYLFIAAVGFVAAVVHEERDRKARSVQLAPVERKEVRRAA